MLAIAKMPNDVATRGLNRLKDMDPATASAVFIQHILDSNSVLVMVDQEATLGSTIKWLCGYFAATNMLL